MSENLALKQYIERIERLEEEKKEVSVNIRDIYAEAKSNGFDPKIMKLIVKMRKMKSNELREQEELLETYMNAIGML